MTKNSAKERIINELKHPSWSPKKIRSIMRAIHKTKTPKEVGTTIFNASKASGCPVDLLMSKARVREAVIGRSFAHYSLRKQGYTLAEIASVFNQNHTSVMYSINSLEVDLELKVERTVDAFNKFKKLEYGL